MSHTRLCVRRKTGERAASVESSLSRTLAALSVSPDECGRRGRFLAGHTAGAASTSYTRDRRERRCLPRLILPRVHSELSDVDKVRRAFQLGRLTDLSSVSHTNEARSAPVGRIGKRSTVTRSGDSESAPL